MSETLCTLRTKGGGGGKYTETVLWTNPSPSSTFAAQTVTLSDSLSNYKYIGIRFKVHNTHADTPYATGIILVSEFMQNRKNTGADRKNILVASQNTSNATMARNAWYVSNTSVEFSAAYQLLSTNTNTNYTIPLEILGLNELATGHKLDRTLLWTNNSPTTSMSTTSVTLSDDMTKYDYLAIKFRNSTTDATEYEDIMKVNDVISCAMFIGTVSTGYYTRRVNQLTDYYTLRFTAGMQPGATATSNTACIPTAIYGVKLS